jgi:outer membrane receptor protein involved in Fe transport
MRYEHYNDVGAVATPKLGAKYSPNDDVDFETSWGKSFKAPTLFQEYLTRAAYLYKPTLLGGSDRTPGDTALYIYGGNPDLKPEHATTWTDTLSWHPRSSPGLRAELSYFQIAYNGRVVLPIQPATVALSNPNFAQFVIFNPTPAEVEADVASAPAGLLNFSGYTYNPATVIAIVNNIYTNVVRQDVHGVDASLIYPFPLWAGQATLTAAGTWLVSHQKTTATSAATALAGTAFYPPHLRSRDGISWEKRGFVLSAFINYIGGIRDVFVTPPTKGDSMTTVDATAVYHAPASAGILSNTDVSLSVLNIGDAHPPYLENHSDYAPHFDSTNYSDIGRFVSFSIAKHF